MRSCTSLLLAVALALAGHLARDGSRARGPAWRVAAAAAQPPEPLNLTQLREESLGMFRFGYGQYMQHAFPLDDLRPISCRGRNSQGGIALTLIDSLDTLVVMGERQQFRQAVRWLAANASFEVDARVHVFELTIRAVGGLLSAHMLVEQDPSLVPGYDGSLLRLAVDLADRFMPAFATPTGVPLSWVNLKHGQIPGDVRHTCTACAGTLLLEFGVLSRLTGNASYEAAARGAVEAIFAMRSPRGLLGNTLDCDGGGWVRTDAGVGAGVDSFYEYLLKAYLAFGDPAYLAMFAEVYAAAMTNLQLDPAWNGHVWLVDVDMRSGQVLHPYVWSLGAFWPGLQALAGQVEEGAALHANWTAAWRRFGWLPEMFDVGLDSRHPTESGYPLRPELMESTFLLHAASGDPSLLREGAALHARLRDANRAPCGYASVGDVATGQLEDTMESFFLSETVKYLYLLFSNTSALVDHFVLSTEGHLLPPFPDAAGSRGHPDAAAGLPSAARRLNCSGGTGECAAPDVAAASSELGTLQQQGEAGQPQRAAPNAQQQGEDGSGVCVWPEAPPGQQDPAGQQRPEASEAAEGEEKWRLWLQSHVALKCASLCADDGDAAAARAESARALRAALPLLPLSPAAPPLLRARRCAACRAVTAAVRHAERAKARSAQQAQRSKEAAAVAKLGLASRRATAANGLPVNRQFLCVVEDTKRGPLACGVLTELPPRQVPPTRLAALPQNYVIVQLTDVAPEAAAAAAAAAAQQQQQQQQQEQCDGEEAAGGEPQPGPGYEVVVEAQLPDGTVSRMEAMLADFGPAFEPGCGEADAEAQRERAAGQPAPPPALAAWRGRRLEVRGGGGAAGERYRLLYVAGTAEEGLAGAEDEEDPYLDEEDNPEDLAAQLQPLEQQQQQQSEAAAASDSPSTGSSGQTGEGVDEGPAAAPPGAGSPPSPDPVDGDAAAAAVPSAVLCVAEAEAAAAQPLHACSELRNAAELAGRIAVVQRGGCMFVRKAAAAAAAGAVGVVVVNSEPTLMAMGTDESGSQTGIPAVLLSSDHGGTLLAALHGGGGGGSGGRVRLRLHAPSDAAAAPEQCQAAPGGGLPGSTSGGGGGGGGAKAQQATLLMSPQAQLWLLNRVAAGSSDPAATFAGVLSQIQRHFQQPAADAHNGGGGGEEEEGEGEEEDEYE